LALQEGIRFSLPIRSQLRSSDENNTGIRAHGNHGIENAKERAKDETEQTAD
jgi:hypothetical protein